MLPDYRLLLTLHLITVVTTISLFTLRGYWKITDSPRLQQKWTHIVPHVNDALLFTFGILLMIKTSQDPVSQQWLMVKLIAVVIYILIGMAVMKARLPTKTRVLLYVLDILLFGYIVGVALSKQPGWVAGVIM